MSADAGLSRGEAPNPMRLGLCSRTKDVIEPLLSPQWYLNCQEMGADAGARARARLLTCAFAHFACSQWSLSARAS